MKSIFEPHQLSLFDATEVAQPLVLTSIDKALSGSFVNNMKLPVHRWFRYSAGFSAEWVRYLVQSRKRSGQDLSVLDPFAGVGTTLLACDAEHVKSVGFETHPFIFRVLRAKLDATSVDLKILRAYLDDFCWTVCAKEPILDLDQPSLLLKCYTPDSLAELSLYKQVYLNEYANDSPESRLLWLVITSMLRSCSTAGTAQWQYVLPRRSKANVSAPAEAFKTKANEIVSDVIYAQRHGWLPLSEIVETDARQPEIARRSFVDLVVTSPPYPNNYDYADATRLEMTYWGEIESWADLQSSVRTHLIRSCSQHARAEHLELESILEEPVLTPIRNELGDACHTLAQVRLTRGGKKNYHTMAAAYFADMGRVFQSLRQICRSGSELCFVVGDSAPYGIYLSVDEWLGQLALASGFLGYKFEKIRDRNVKWKNRKHRVPLKEGRLWIEG